MESKNAILIEKPSRLVPSPSEESWIKKCRHRQVGHNKGHNFITDDEFLRKIRDLILMVELLAGVSIYYVIVGGRS